MEPEHWELSDEAKNSSQRFLDLLRKIGPEMLAVQMFRLMVLAKEFLPVMTTKEAKLLVRCFCAFGLPEAETVPPGEIAKMIADHVRETFLVEFGAEGLANEMKEFGNDPEWQTRFREMPENVFASRLERTLDPFQAYLLVVMCELYWEREAATTPPGGSSGKAILSDYFNIEDPPSMGGSSL